ncbi:MAG: hypothetical protein MR428_01180 [Mesosutterella sp.]|nr:hypothetical protein [Mesosutterella sp.]
MSIFCVKRVFPNRRSSARKSEETLQSQPPLAAGIVSSATATSRTTSGFARSS